MASTIEYSQVTDWNRLGLRGYSQERASAFSRQYVVFTIAMRARGPGAWTEVGSPELSDDELLEAAEQEGHFSFLDDPAEDIYTWDDGEEV